MAAEVFLALRPEDWAARAWQMQPHLEKMAAGSGGRFAARDIDAAILEGRQQAWIVSFDGAVVALMLTEIAQYPQIRALRMIGVVGERAHHWGRLLPLVKRTARDWGCTRLEAMHPPGWRMAARGWSAFHVLSEMEL